MVVNLCGRGDKDIPQIAEILGGACERPPLVPRPLSPESRQDPMTNRTP